MRACTHNSTATKSFPASSALYFLLKNIFLQTEYGVDANFWTEKNFVQFCFTFALSLSLFLSLSLSLSLSLFLFQKKQNKKKQKLVFGEVNDTLNGPILSGLVIDISNFLKSHNFELKYGLLCQVCVMTTSSILGKLY